VTSLAMLAATAAPALAHAVLLHTVPTASGTLTSSPPTVALTFDEPIEPRFAIISVTDAGGHQQAAGQPVNAPGDATTVEVPVKQLGQGWYLVYWRVISADGHPVRGAFTFAVGPNPGPAPQFVIPSLSETSVTPSLVSLRWASFLTLMSAIGLFAFAAMVARPAAPVCPRSARRCAQAFAVACLLALIAIPVYIELETAEFALRPVTDLSAVVPLMRDSPLGRAWLDLELVMVLLLFSGAVALRVDRVRSRPRSVAALLATTGAVATAAAAAAVPGLAGHAAQTYPVGISLASDWVHVASVSVWIGGLIGLSVLAATTPAEDRLEVLGRVVPRFSQVALVSVLLIIASGVVSAILHLPTLGSLYQTSYGKAIIAKVLLLVLALMLATVNRTRTTPRLRAALEQSDETLGASAGRALRRLVGGEVAIVVGIILAAAILTSLPPPAKALAEVGQASAHIGPGAIERLKLTHGPYTLYVSITPNRAAQPSTYVVRVTKNGAPLDGATMIAHFAMLDMEMGTQAYQMKPAGQGVYTLVTPALVMVGHWGLGFEVDPPGGAAPFTVIVVDHAEG
jgi:copper transport protein